MSIDRVNWHVSEKDREREREHTQRKKERENEREKEKNDVESLCECRRNKANERTFF